MKTKQELVHDFMVALTANPKMIDNSIYENATYIYMQALALTDKYLEELDDSE